MFTISLETPADADGIEDLLDATFGTDRHAKAVYVLRQGVAPLGPLCFTGWLDGTLIATLRFWPMAVAGKTPILLLGPIAVRPDLQGLGYGIALLRHGLAEAQRQGWQAVALVGDEPYYARVGFSRDTASGLSVPGLKEEHRLLARELQPGALGTVTGPIEQAGGQARCVRAA